MSRSPQGRAPSLRRRDRAGLAVVTSLLLLGVWALAGLAERAGDEVALRRLGGGVVGSAVGAGDLGARFAVPPGLRIEEVVTSSARSLTDEDGDHPDWLELHNPTASPHPLGGLVLRTSARERGWALPDRVLAPGERLLVHASGKDRAEPDGPLHTDFRLPQRGVEVILARADGREVVDRVAVPALARDTSFGRDPHEPGRWCHFAFPTPGEANPPECHDERLGVPAFSLGSGFYDEPITLTMDPPPVGAELLYTLDGSYPDPVANPTSTLTYDGPLTIADRSDEPDRLTSIETSFFWGEHQDPLGPVAKATVVRARTLYGRERVEVFFVGEQHRRDLLPVLHLAADAEHLFDHDRGIYVPGRLHEEYLASDEFDPDHRWNVPANYRGRGRAWERPAEDDLQRQIVLHHCDPGGSCDFAAPVGLRTHGNVSRTFPVKTLRVYARRDYGPAELEHAFFGDRADERHRRLLLRNAGNDWNGTLLVDGFLQSLVAHLGNETQAYQPAVLYLNGEYWGVHNLRERYDQHYLALTHGLDADEVVVVGHRLAVEHGAEQDLDGLRVLLELLAAEVGPRLDEVVPPPGSEPPDEETVLLAPPVGTLPAELRDLLEQQVDVDALIDYLALELFSGNNDWPRNNVRLWRARSAVEGVPVADGRWRWMVFDLDQAGGGVGGFDPSVSLLDRLLTGLDDPAASHGLPTLTQALLADEEYRARLLTRLADHLNTTFAPQRTVPELERLVAQLEPEIASHAARWPTFGTVDEWESRIETLQAFLAARPAEQFEDLDAVLGLGGTFTVTVDPAVGGRVQVGTLELDAELPSAVDAEGTVSGRYFRDVPLEVVARPDPGHRFVRWDGADGAGATDAVRVLLGGEDVELTPVFAPS
jgi:hypothetical protein